MKIAKAVARMLLSLAGGAALIYGALWAFGQVNEKKLYECRPAHTSMSIVVVKWRLTGGYGLGILNAYDAVLYAENNDSPEPLRQKAEQFCTVAARECRPGPQQPRREGRGC